jgi:hypothetical protein
MDKNLQKLIDSGIAVWKAEFHAAVNNTDDVPETYFSSESKVPSRRVKMLYTPAGLLCEHKDKFFMVPHASVKYCKFL